MPPIIALYEAVVSAIRQLGLPTCTPAQDMPNKRPFCQVQLLNRNATNQYQTAHEYTYSFQLDVVTNKNDLVSGLKYAYQITRTLHQVTIDGYAVGLESDPSIASLVDVSTNQLLNRQLITGTFVIVEDTAF